MSQLVALLKTMRPKQWIKNAFVFGALVFDVKFFDPTYLWQSILGFLLFSLISGVVYTLNDLVDIEKDRAHPKKRYRALPSGELSPRVAQIAVVVIAGAALLLGAWLSTGFALILGGYLVLQITYSFVLKNVVLLDVMAIAAGFVLRVAAGVPLVDAERFSPWLYICTTLLALFLALGKRRGELVLLGAEAGRHRESLNHYTVPLLDQLVSLVTWSTILAYAP